MTEDSEVIDFDIPDGGQPADIVGQLRQMITAIKKNARIEEERTKDPRWRLVPIHVMFSRLICGLAGHDWHYFSLKRADTGELEFFRCCMRCEKSEKEIALGRWPSGLS